MANQYQSSTYYAGGVKPVYNPTHTGDHDVTIDLPIGKPSLSTFAYRTLRWVFAQLCVTAAISGWMYANHTEVVEYLNNNPGSMWVPIIMSFVSLFGLFCSRGSKTCTSIMFALFTISTSLMVGASVLQYAPDVVLKAVVATVLVVGMASIYSWWCAKNGHDLDFLGPALCTVLVTIIIVSIMNIFIKSSMLGLCICVISVFLFTGFLIFDLERLYSGREESDDIFAEPMIAAVGIYLDIINLFLNLLEVIDRCSR